MAEKEEVHSHANKRNPHVNRGRPGQNRLYHHLGVRDLREILDRKRSERGYAGEASVPPPDPSYDFLKDPMRENAENVEENQLRKKKHFNKVNQSKNRDIENPLNIKVEFSTSTGEHVYKMDESTVLPTIKHIPDRPPPQNRPFRGRGRGRGRGQRNYHTRTIRNKKHSDENVNENAQVEDAQAITVSVEENWDIDLNKAEEEGEEGDFPDHEGEVPTQTEEILDKSEKDSLEKRVENLKLDQPTEQEEILNEIKETNQ